MSKLITYLTESAVAIRWITLY